MGQHKAVTDPAVRAKNRVRFQELKGMAQPELRTFKQMRADERRRFQRAVEALAFRNALRRRAR